LTQDKFMRQTGTSWAGKTTMNEPATNNVRVKLPDRDEEDLSDVDPDAEVSAFSPLVRSGGKRKDEDKARSSTEGRPSG